MDLDDPVVDQAGYVYEKFFAEKYIKDHHGSVECPVGGESCILARVCPTCVLLFMVLLFMKHEGGMSMLSWASYQHVCVSCIMNMCFECPCCRNHLDGSFVYSC